jgi:hypothetical protein
LAFNVEWHDRHNAQHPPPNVELSRIHDDYQYRLDRCCSRIHCFFGEARPSSAAATSHYTFGSLSRFRPAKPTGKSLVEMSVRWVELAGVWWVRYHAITRRISVNCLSSPVCILRCRSAPKHQGRRYLRFNAMLQSISAFPFHCSF